MRAQFTLKEEAEVKLRLWDKCANIRDMVGKREGVMEGGSMAVLAI